VRRFSFAGEQQDSDTAPLKLVRRLLSAFRTNPRPDEQLDDRTNDGKGKPVSCD